MKALTFLEVGKVGYESIPDPSILAGSDVIVKVSSCAICGSDLHVFYGREKGIDTHTAMGHEFAGEVVEVGKEVRSLKKGDLVMSPFTTSCGNCYYCRIGLTCRCIHSQLFGWVEKEKGLQGGQGELVRVPLADNTLVKVPEGVTTKEALLLGDVMSTGFYAAKQAVTRGGETCVVVGCGPVGLMAVIAAIHYGADRVYAIDSLPERLSMANQFGAKRDQRVAAVLQLAFDLVRPGGIVSSVGVCNDPIFPFAPVDAYNKNLTYKSGRCPARSMIDELLPVVISKKYPVEQIFTHQMKLNDGVKAYDVFANKKENCLKVVLQP